MDQSSDHGPTMGAAPTNSAPTNPASIAAPMNPMTAPNLSEPARGFLIELTHAMQAAADKQREATNAEVGSMTAAHLERVRARAAAEAEELRRMAQSDVDGIHAWQEAEAERIRAEAERRILARGEELDSYLVRHAAIIDGEVEQIEGAVATYQMRLDEYFDTLTTESSPAEIARLADEIPEPPDLAKVGGAARAQAVAAIAAEDDDNSFSPTAPGPELVPVMAPPSGSADAGSNGPTNGSNGANGEHTNPAIRLLRSLATLATPADARPADAVADPSAEPPTPEPGVEVVEAAKD